MGSSATKELVALLNNHAVRLMQAAQSDWQVTADRFDRGEEPLPHGETLVGQLGRELRPIDNDGAFFRAHDAALRECATLGQLGAFQAVFAQAKRSYWRAWELARQAFSLPDRLNFATPEFSALTRDIGEIDDLLPALNLVDESAGHPANAFLDPDCREMWRAILTIRAGGQQIDKILLLAELRKQNPSDHTHWESLLVQAVSSEAIAANATHYASIVRDRASRRKLLLMGEEMICQGSSPDGLDKSILASFEEQIADIRVGTTNAGKVLTYRCLTCAELDAAEYATEYLIEWLLVAGQPCIVAGQKKSLKTSILLDMAIALAIGGRFLGFFRVSRAARVCVMTGESGLATIQETLRRIAEAAGRRLADIGNLVISDQLPIFGNLEHIDALRQLLVENEIEVLILDPAYLCIPADGHEGSLFAMGQLLRGLSEMCQSLGVTLVLAHHTKRSVADPFAPPELEDIAWAGFQEFARQWILLGRMVRYEPGKGIHQLWVNVGGSAGHSSMWAVAIAEGTSDDGAQREWHVRVRKAEEARREAEDEKEQAKQQKLADQLRRDANALRTAMAKWPNGETLNVLRGAAGLSGTHANAALKVLLDEATAVLCPVTKGNQKTPRDGYRLTNESDQADQSDKAIGQASPTRDHHQSDSSPVRGCPSPTGGEPKRQTSRTCPSGRRRATKKRPKKSPEDS